ncbi:MAG: hypothetical protein A4E67_02271 [Syntrophaceae bacterium PtaB.Bin038]|nr:MAG: hypothetical protein A4E67_02271 [Syntrophaceae bacterium PtaB.Bin038]
MVIRLLQGLQDHLFFQLLDGILELALPRGLRGAGEAVPEGQIGDRDDRVAGDDHGALENVDQFAHVARVIVLDQLVPGFLAHPLDLLAVLRRELREEMVDQGGNVLLALPQRREVHVHHVETVEEVLAERAVPDPGLEVAVRGGDDPDVGMQDLVAPDPLELALLEEPQQLDLHGRGQLPDLVEEERPPVGLLEASDAPCRRPGEGPPLVAEELALQQRLGQRPAVDGDQRPRRPRAQVVDETGEEFLPRAALPADEHGGPARGDPSRQIHEAFHLGAAEDDLVGRDPFFLQAPAHHLVLPQQDAPLRDAVDVQQELVEIDGLRHVVDGPRLHGLDGRLDRAVGGHHDDVELRVELLHLLQHLQAVHARHLVVHQQEVEVGRPHLGERLFARFGLGHGMSFLSQEVA